MFGKYIFIDTNSKLNSTTLQNVSRHAHLSWCTSIWLPPCNNQFLFMIVKAEVFSNARFAEIVSVIILNLNLLSRKAWKTPFCLQRDFTNFTKHGLPWVPEVFLACGGTFSVLAEGRSHERRGTGHCKDLRETGNLARKVSGTQGNKGGHQYKSFQGHERTLFQFFRMNSNLQSINHFNLRLVSEYEQLWFATDLYL